MIVDVPFRGICGERLYLKLGEGVRFVVLDSRISPDAIALLKESLPRDFIGVFQQQALNGPWLPVDVAHFDSDGEFSRPMSAYVPPSDWDSNGAELVLSYAERQSWNTQFNGSRLELTKPFKDFLRLRNATQEDCNRLLQSFEGLSCVTGLESGDDRVLVRRIAHALDSCEGRPDQRKTLVVSMTGMDLDLRFVQSLESTDIAVATADAIAAAGPFPELLVQSPEGTRVYAFPKTSIVRELEWHAMGPKQLRSCNAEDPPAAARGEHVPVPVGMLESINQMRVAEVSNFTLDPLARIIGDYLAPGPTEEIAALNAFCTALGAFKGRFDIFGCHDEPFRRTLDAAKFRAWMLPADPREFAARREEMGSEAFDALKVAARNLYESELFVKSSQYVSDLGIRHGWVDRKRAPYPKPRGEIVAHNICHRNRDNPFFLQREALVALADSFQKLDALRGTPEPVENFIVPALYPGLEIPMGRSTIRLISHKLDGGWEVAPLDPLAPRLFGKPPGLTNFDVGWDDVYSRCLRPTESDQPCGQSRGVQAYAQRIDAARFNLFRLVDGAADPVNSLKEFLHRALKFTAERQIMLGVADGLEHVTIDGNAVGNPGFMTYFGEVVLHLMHTVRRIDVVGAGAPGLEPGSLANLRRIIEKRAPPARQRAPSDGYALLAVLADRIDQVLREKPDTNNFTIGDEVALRALSHVTEIAVDAFAAVYSKSVRYLSLDGPHAPHIDMNPAVLSKLPFERFFMPQPAKGDVVDLRRMHTNKTVRFMDWPRECVIHAPAGLLIEIPEGSQATVIFYLPDGQSFEVRLEGGKNKWWLS
jgi:hypothetical protein